MRRIFAWFIDIFVYLLIWMLNVSDLFVYVYASIHRIDITEVPLITQVLCEILLMILYNILVEPILLGTIGKKIMGLKIQTFNCAKPLRIIVFLRAIIKFLSSLSGVGLIINAYFVGVLGYAWYDRLLGLQVIYQKKVRLTETQKNFRKTMKRYKD